jgi:hypothetical protein
VWRRTTGNGADRQAGWTFSVVRLVPALLALGACADTDALNSDIAAVARQAESRLGYAEDSAPPPEGAAPGTCWAADRAPRTFEQVVGREPVEGDSPESGSALMVRERRQPVTSGGELLFFETPCKADLTPELIETLQRALAARNFYSGDVTGRIEPQTREAIRIWQAEHGLNSAILSMDTARELGLIAYERPPAEPADPRFAENPANTAALSGTTADSTVRLVGGSAIY